ncbi:MAG: hypothetical protein ACM3JJ_11460 [Hyphomicrobiales bacterium]
MAVAALLVALLSGGCIFSPKKEKSGGGGTPPPPVPPRTSPHSAIDFLIYAWNYRDSTLAEQVYASDYSGTSVDQSDPQTGTLSFTKADEVRALGGLELATDITRVEVNFGPSTTWVDSKYVGDPPDWVSVAIPKPTVNIYTTSDTYTATGADNFEFKLRPVPASPDTLWEIVRWSESKPATSP